MRSDTVIFPQRVSLTYEGHQSCSLQPARVLALIWCESGGREILAYRFARYMSFNLVPIKCQFCTDRNQFTSINSLFCADSRLAFKSRVFYWQKKNLFEMVVGNNHGVFEPKLWAG